jgi:hypothetical protein
MGNYEYLIITINLIFGGAWPLFFPLFKFWGQHNLAPGFTTYEGIVLTAIQYT